MAGTLKRALVLLLALAAFAGGLLPATALAAAAGAKTPSSVAEAYVVIDAATGQVVVEKNMHQAEYPASITKALTLALTLQEAQARGDTAATELVVSRRAVTELMNGASTAGLQEGEVVTLGDMLYATQILSANDGANVLAEYVDGSIEGFAARMNRKAAELGLSGSNFTNPSGQTDREHRVTAYDMAQITRWALTIPGFREIFAATEYRMGPTNFRAAGYEATNKNSIWTETSFYYYPHTTGSKQGYTDDARYTLLTTAQKGDTELICVVLNSPTNAGKYTTTIELLDYCFDNFSRVTFPGAGVQPGCIPVYGGGAERLGEIDITAEDASFLLHNSLSVNDVTPVCNLPESYVVGAQFHPTVHYTIENSRGLQYGEIMTSPLSWSGLDEILAANTTPWERITSSPSLVFWLFFCLPVALISAVLLRVVHLRSRQNQHRQARLAAVRAQMSVQVAPRPAPRLQDLEQSAARNGRKGDSANKTAKKPAAKKPGTTAAAFSRSKALSSPRPKKPAAQSTSPMRKPGLSVQGADAAKTASSAARKQHLGDPRRQAGRGATRAAANDPAAQRAGFQVVSSAYTDMPRRVGQAR